MTVKRDQYLIMLAVQGPDLVPRALASALQLHYDPRFAHQRGDEFVVEKETRRREEASCRCG